MSGPSPWRYGAALATEREGAGGDDPAGAVHDPTFRANRIVASEATTIPGTFRFHELVSAAILLNGQPFRLHTPGIPSEGIAEQRRDYLVPIYDNFFPEVELIFARQCEKSTTGSHIMLGTNLVFPHYRWLYLNASLTQVSDFSRDKLDGRILESPILRSYLYNADSHNVHDKKFKTGGFIALRGMYRGADRSRGLSVDGLFADEVQDILTDHLQVAFESQTHSLHPEKRRIYCGTPKTFDNTMERLRRKSKQFEYMFFCEHCGKDQFIDIPNIGDDYLICAKCKKDLRWSPRAWKCVDNASETRYSFRLPQVIGPWIMYNPIEWKTNIVASLREYPHSLFLNEKLALAAGDAERPVTEGMLRACCKSGVVFTAPRKLGRCVAAVDYGRGSRSYTVLVVVHFNAVGKPQLVFAKKFKGAEANPLVYTGQIIKTVEDWGCEGVACDAGDGFHQNKDLQFKMGFNKVWVFNAAGTLREEVAWNSSNKEYNFNRTKQLDKRFTEISHGQVEFPDWSVAEPFLTDLLNVYSEYTAAGNVIYDHPDDCPDDFLHAWNMALMVGELKKHWISPIKLGEGAKPIAPQAMQNTLARYIRQRGLRSR